MLQQNTIQEIEALQSMLVDHATGGQVSDSDYKKTRAKVITNPTVKNDIPTFVKNCRDIGQFWVFIKHKFPTYQERRNFIWEGFSTILTRLETEQTYPSDDTTSQKLENLSQSYIQQEWTKALERRSIDPEAAITSARSLLETVCKFVLESNDIKYKYSDDLPKLYKQASESLNLSPTQHTENIFKEILSGCISIVKGLGALRNQLSDAHGKSGNYIKPSQRHAEFAVNIAGATSTFLLETLETNKK